MKKKQITVMGVATAESECAYVKRRTDMICHLFLISIPIVLMIGSGKHNGGSESGTHYSNETVPSQMTQSENPVRTVMTQRVVVAPDSPEQSPHACAPIFAISRNHPPGYIHPSTGTSTKGVHLPGVRRTRRRHNSGLLPRS